ncbi:uncharacterized protein BYT42DRAFT_307794 [Radiomyces spectabilis]|uniref:uncharacterized protein n=1 Tax=Radiomyces spectabilis TaxID=64574 RepID=UPI00222060E2|nr:uncharacterized protein BYT42DRAFT_307794 [Radiomyces spectabilis]KAI8381507.1 hypothetical protein BYT42DRAFT_307794 [Radiomyces spectabilis]
MMMLKQERRRSGGTSSDESTSSGSSTRFEDELEDVVDSFNTFEFENAAEPSLISPAFLHDADGVKDAFHRPSLPKRGYLAMPLSKSTGHYHRLTNNGLLWQQNSSYKTPEQIRCELSKVQRSGSKRSVHNLKARRDGSSHVFKSTSRENQEKRSLSDVPQPRTTMIQRSQTITIGSRQGIDGRRNAIVLLSRASTMKQLPKIPNVDKPMPVIPNRKATKHAEKVSR